jgi:hypothetical protein
VNRDEIHHLYFLLDVSRPHHSWRLKVNQHPSLNRSASHMYNEFLTRKSVRYLAFNCGRFFLLKPMMFIGEQQYLQMNFGLSVSISPALSLSVLSE